MNGLLTKEHPAGITSAENPQKIINDFIHTLAQASLSPTTMNSETKSQFLQRTQEFLKLAQMSHQKRTDEPLRNSRSASLRGQRKLLRLLTNEPIITNGDSTNPLESLSLATLKNILSYTQELSLQLSDEPKSSPSVNGSNHQVTPIEETRNQPSDTAQAYISEVRNLSDGKMEVRIQSFLPADAWSIYANVTDKNNSNLDKLDKKDNVETFHVKKRFGSTFIFEVDINKAPYTFHSQHSHPSLIVPDTHLQITAKDLRQFSRKARNLEMLEDIDKLETQANEPQPSNTRIEVKKGDELQLSDPKIEWKKGGVTVLRFSGKAWQKIGVNVEFCQEPQLQPIMVERTDVIDPEGKSRITIPTPENFVGEPKLHFSCL